MIKKSGPGSYSFNSPIGSMIKQVSCSKYKKIAKSQVILKALTETIWRIWNILGLHRECANSSKKMKKEKKKEVKLMNFYGRELSCTKQLPTTI